MTYKAFLAVWAFLLDCDPASISDDFIDPRWDHYQNIMTKSDFDFFLKRFGVEKYDYLLKPHHLSN